MHIDRLKLALLAFCALPALALMTSCAPKPTPALGMEVCYYDSPMGNVIEIPCLTGDDSTGALTLQSALTDLAGEFQRYQENPYADGTWCEVVAYPCTTERYLNAIVVANIYPNYGTSGELYSWVYDKKEHRLVDLEEALQMAGTTREDMRASLKERYAASGPGLADCELRGFRIRPGGDVDFYLYASNADTYPDGTPGPDSWRNIFTWSGGTLTQMVSGLIPGDEVDSFDSPLWCQWPDGVAPEGLVQAVPFPVVPTELDFHSLCTRDWGWGGGLCLEEDLRAQWQDFLWGEINGAGHFLNVLAGNHATDELVSTDADGVGWYRCGSYASVRELRKAADNMFTPGTASAFTAVLDGKDSPFRDIGGVLCQREGAASAPGYPEAGAFLFDAVSLLEIEGERVVFALPNAESGTLSRFVLIKDTSEEARWRFETYAEPLDLPFQDSLLGALWEHIHSWTYRAYGDADYYTWAVAVTGLKQYPAQAAQDGTAAFQIYELSYEVPPLGSGSAWLIFAVEGEQQIFLGSLPTGAEGPGDEGFTRGMEELFAAVRARTARQKEGSGPDWSPNHWPVSLSPQPPY